MKVLHLIGGGDVGGAKTHVLSLVKELSKHIDVKIVSFRRSSFSDEAKAMDINIEIIHSGIIFLDIFRVIRIIKTDGYDIIHSHGAKANMFAVISRIFTKLPSVTTVHSDYKLDYMQSTAKRFSFGLINTISLRFINYYINVSKNLEELLLKRKFNRMNVFSLPNGIDFNDVPLNSRTDFSKKYNLNLSQDDIVVGVLARLTPIKGIDTFLNAAKSVLDEDTSIKFLIGGDGDERKALEKKAAELGISKNVFFLGYVNSRDFMSCIDINVLTSLSEGFPYSILEGAVSKKATISSNVGGISDLIENNRTGFLFPAKNYERLSEFILELSRNKSLRTQIGQNIYEKAKIDFSLDRMCEIQLSIYDKILKSTGYSYSRLKKRASFEHDAIITGYYGFKNIGDDAILKTIISDLKSLRPDIKLLVLSKIPSETAEVYGVDSIKRKNLLSIITAMSHSRILIHGGGTLIQDNTSTRSLMYYLGTLWLAKRMGLKVMLYANGIGPIRRSLNRVASRIVISKVDVITLREEVSRQELINLFIFKPKLVVTADPALIVKPVSTEEIDKLFVKENIPLEGQFAGFSIRNWYNPSNYEETIAKVADYMIEKYNIKPVFIPMQYPNDLEASIKIVSKMQGKAYIIKNKYGLTSEDYIAGIINRMDILIGMRLHSLIFAAGLGVPVVGIVYDSKIESFLKYINRPQSAAGYINNLNIEQFKFIIDETWNNRETIGRDTKKFILDCEAKAFENARIAIELLEECDGGKNAKHS
ncbi:MAG: polysaccharide pyruvyl transferase CsaB [Clostridia bacterium]|jgi:polysaccharide pyruvyl transferase CsaB